MTSEIANESLPDAFPADASEAAGTDAPTDLPSPEETAPAEERAKEAEVSADAGEMQKKSAPPVDYAALAAEDLLALKREFPELSSLGDLTELEDPARYGALRDLGLSAREAYLATTTPRRMPREDNRAHLHSAVPKAVRASGDGMSEGELSAARELFFGLGDAELHRLYQKVTK